MVSIKVCRLSSRGRIDPKHLPFPSYKHRVCLSASHFYNKISIELSKRLDRHIKQTTMTLRSQRLREPEPKEKINARIMQEKPIDDQEENRGFNSSSWHVRGSMPIIRKELNYFWFLLMIPTKSECFWKNVDKLLTKPNVLKIVRFQYSLYKMKPVLDCHPYYFWKFSRFNSFHWNNSISKK